MYGVSFVPLSATYDDVEWNNNYTGGDEKSKSGAEKWK